MKLQDYHQIQRNYQASGALLEVGQRIAMLESLEKGLKKYEKDLEQALYQDLGKSVPEVHFSELQAVYGEIRLFRRKIKKWSGFRRKKAGITNFPSRAYVHRSPYGCVLIIAPWNYPYRLSLSPLVGAIAGGNSVMMKLSERIHASTALLEKILAESLPKEVLHMIPADAPPEQIWSVPYDMVFFTGSVKTGRTIAKECGDRMIPCVLELGGKSPVVLLDDADVGLAAKRILWGKGFNAGQTCIAPDHVYLKKDQLEPFVSAFKDYHKKYYPQGMDTEYYPKLVDDKHFDQLFALREGGRVVYGGDYRREDLKMDLTLITDVVKNSPLDKEEIFGPILPLYLYEDEEALRQKLWSMETPLAFYIFTKNKSRGRQWLRDIPFGGACLNDTLSHINSRQLPFGGMGPSGMGHYQGYHSFTAFTHPKGISERPGWEPEIRYPPLPNLWKKNKPR